MKNSFLYVFRDVRTDLYITRHSGTGDFSPSVNYDQMIHMIFNDTEPYSLVVISNESVLTAMLVNKQANDKLWADLGGFDNLEIIKLNIAIEPMVYDPIHLVNMIINEEREIDYGNFSIHD